MLLVGQQREAIEADPQPLTLPHVPRAVRILCQIDSGNPQALEIFAKKAARAADRFAGQYEHAGELRPEYRLETDPPRSSSGGPTPAGERLNRWLQSAQGRTAGRELARDTIDLLRRLGELGLPAHDRRHIQVKVIGSALQVALEEKLSPSQKLFLIPAALHDIGKHLEGQTRALGAGHEIVSFFVLQQLLADHAAVPEILRVHLLAAVLEHSSGACRTSFIAQAVQRADREQLVGPEILHRALLDTCGVKGKPFESYLATLQRHRNNLYPQIGRWGEVRADRLKQVVDDFLALASPKSGETKAAASVRSVSMEALLTKVYAMVTPPYGPDPKRVPIGTATVWGNVVRAVSALPHFKRAALFGAAEFAISTREQHDAAENELLRGPDTRLVPGSVPFAFATMLRSFDYQKRW